MISWPPGIFVVGTDTGVGKTRVASAIARTWMLDGKRVGVLKPVSSGGTVVDGTVRSPDVEALIAAISTTGAPFPPPPRDRVGPLIFEAPLAPPIAARRSGVVLAAADILKSTDESIQWWVETARADLLVVEGVGGLLCPIAEGGWTVADLAIRLDYPLLIVAHRGLGTLNHTLLTVEAALSRGLRVAGIVLNATRPTVEPAAEATNAAELASLLPGMAILADWPFDQDESHVPVAPEANHWLGLPQTPRRVQHQTAQPGGFLASRSGRSQFSGSDDELLAAVEPVDLFGPSSSMATTTPVEPSKLNAPALPSSDGSGFNLDIDPGRARGLAGSQDIALGSNDRDDAGSAATSWRSVLVTSYASAVTLALIWTLLQTRGSRPSVVTPPPVAVAEKFSDKGELGTQSRKVEAIRPISGDHLLKLGQVRDFGSLQVEPKAISRQDLKLERVNLVGKTERRDGPKRAVVLTMRIQNRSPDLVFAPVDPAFVRGRSDNVFETLLELDDGRKIYPNPLAIASEWTVVGETFADLRPGESRDVIFATDANAPVNAERQAGTWRIKLRTGLDTTTEFGVRLPGGPPTP